MQAYASGSYRRHRCKTTADQSRSLDVNWLTREGVFDTEGSTYCSVTWSDPYRGNASVAIEVNMSQRWMLLNYRFLQAGERVNYRIPLTRTGLPWGGHRWWFTCPLTGGRPCERRVGKLYLPPGTRYFGCRHCHDLTYESAQQSHRYDRIFNMSSAEICVVGFDPHGVLADQRLEERRMRQVIRNEQRRRRRKALSWS